ncbi:tripartite tricarboxylate transporter TctB family protein [Falsihalocynthiibacter sp. SS001]|uniref:tripartite tricarboxylate transporter TctB family protein n=1 Tax=Falsihalocynthiibacter sp. SS001 TaxID=3349698 RepID=UPI0036D34EB5
MASDRIFGLVMALVALAYIAGATQIQTSFLQDPVGPKAFPIGIGIVAALCSIYMVLRPDPEPEWPAVRTFGAILVAVVVLVVYAMVLKPLGFLIPTAITAAILSYQISPDVKRSAVAGVGLSIGLFVVFKFALGLGLVALPKMISG